MLPLGAAGNAWVELPAACAAGGAEVAWGEPKAAAETGKDVGPVHPSTKQHEQ